MDRIIRNIAHFVNHGGFWWFTGWLIEYGHGQCDGRLYDGPIQVCADAIEAFESDYIYRLGDLDGSWTWLGAGWFNEVSIPEGCSK